MLSGRLGTLALPRVTSLDQAAHLNYILMRPFAVLQMIDRLRATRTSSCLVILVGEPHQGQLALITSLAPTRPHDIALTVLQLGQCAFEDGNEDWLVTALADGLSSFPATPPAGGLLPCSPSDWPCCPCHPC